MIILNFSFDFTDFNPLLVKKKTQIPVFFLLRLFLLICFFLLVRLLSK